jgi:glycogen debranching enzyme
MDNTPRESVAKGGWIDMSSQQALVAKSIAEIASLINELKIASDYYKKYSDLKNVVNKFCWDDFEKFYYDVSREGELSNTKHIGSFWTLISGVADSLHLEGLINHLTNPNEFWRPHLVPTLSANDSQYNSSGHYWLGGVWAPTNYMLTAGLEKYEYYDIAFAIAENHIKNISEVYKTFQPDEDKIAFEERYADGYKTIWECYSPEFIEPATRWDNTFYSRQDFVGWSGLSPIAMLIENIIGLEVNSSKNRITWRINRTDKHGIKNLNFKKEKVDLICTPLLKGIQFEVKCKTSFTLEIFWNNKKHSKLLNPGFNLFAIIE